MGERNRNRGQVLAMLAMTMAVTLLLLLATPAMSAPCTESGSRGPINIKVPNIVVPRDAPVGAVLAEVVSDTSSYRLDCSGPNNVVRTTLGGLLRGNVMEVLGQNGDPIPGLGVRMKVASNLIAQADGSCGGFNMTLGAMHQLNCRYYVSANGTPSGIAFSYGQLTLTFVKTTAALTSAKLGPYMVLTIRTDNYTPIEYRITGGAVVANPCTFDIPGNVSLGSVSVTAMNEGQVAPAADFQIRVNCSDSARYRLKFTPSAGSGAVAGVKGAMSNSAAAGAAKNVNVQLQNSAGAPVALATDIDHGVQQAVSAVSYRAAMVRNGSGKVEAGSVTAALEVSFTFY
ncbi:P pilus assembly protein, pilin FimA [Herbaspirillum sp. YR522]|nr:P pilus assembly protein, pilin FimA [Herbaspirillum sp. YR522]